MLSGETFVGRMKRASRKYHALSDKLINAKLALSMNSDEVWSEGLLVFYEIFKFLEDAMLERRNENLGLIFIKGLARTRAFEEDLSHYLEGNWKMSSKAREAVDQYLERMQNLLDTDSDMLIPYVYHLYMGLLSGGQILKRKRDLESIFLFQGEGSHVGESVINFAPFKISELKAEFKNTVNLIGDNLSDQKQNLLIQEGEKVFELNNAVLKTIATPDRVISERAMLFSFGVAALLLAYCLFSR